MSSPALGLTMLGLIVIAIMMGFPTAFTLMGLGMIFGYIAFLTPGLPWYDNRIFDRWPSPRSWYARSGASLPGSSARWWC